MPRFAWLTPNIPPANYICRRVFIPADVDWLAIVSGALVELTLPENFELQGTYTPEETAALFFEIFNDYSFQKGRACKLIGEIILWSGPLNPDDSVMLLCDGTHVSNVDYPDLYDIIATIYGGTGPTDFALPDLRGRVPIGESAVHLFADTGGLDEVTLTTNEMPSHTHTDTGHTHAESAAAPNLTTIGPGAPEPTAIPSVGVTATGNASLTNTGNGAPHENMQPYLTLNYYIVVL